MSKHLGKIGLVVVAIIWGTGFVASAMALDFFGPNEILVMRFTLSFIVLLLINLPRLKQFKRGNLLKGGLVGIFLYLGFFFQTVGLQYTTPSNNAFLTAVNIVIVPFLGLVILRQIISYQSIIGAMITFVGIGFISLQSGFSSINRGDVLTLICAVFFALHIFSTDILSKKIATWELLLPQMGVASLLAWLGLFISGEKNVLQGKADLSFSAFLPILYLGLISTLVAYFIQTLSQKTTSSTEAAVILSTEAFFGMLASVMILGEVVTKNMMFGGVLIFLGIVIVEVDFIQFNHLWRRRNEEKESNH